MASFFHSCSSWSAMRRVFTAVASAFRYCATAAAKSGDDTTARPCPAATWAPSSTSSRTTGPEMGASTWVL